MTAIQDNGIIYMTRGDTFQCPLYTNIGTLLHPEWYTLQDGDKLYFGLMQPHENFEDAILKKVYDNSSEKDTDGFTLLKLVPEDTLKLAVGKYYYSVKLLKANGEVHTVNVPTLFYITD